MSDAKLGGVRFGIGFVTSDPGFVPGGDTPAAGPLWERSVGGGVRFG